MGDGDGVAMIERSAGKSVRYGPGGDGRPVCHTNHPLVCDDWTLPEGGALAQPMPSRSSYLRLASLHQRLHAGAEITVDMLKATLSARDDADYPVSRGGGVNLQDGQIGFTLASNVFELRRGEPTWHMAAGPPHLRPFHVYRFD